VILDEHPGGVTPMARRRTWIRICRRCWSYLGPASVVWVPVP